MRLLPAVVLLAACSEGARVAVDPRGFPEDVAIVAVIDADTGAGTIVANTGAPIELAKAGAGVVVLGFAEHTLDRALIPAGATVARATEVDPLLPRPTFFAHATVGGDFARLVIDDPAEVRVMELTAPWIPACHTVIVRGDHVEAHCNDTALTCRGPRADSDLFENRPCAALEHRERTARALASCSGGDPQLGADPPDVHLRFPQPAWVTDADELSVSGTLDHSVAIASLRVNGVEATTERCFETWSASIPIDRNTFVVDAIDALGHETRPLEVASVRHEGIVQTPNGIAYDEARGVALISDRTGIRSVELSGAPPHPIRVVADFAHGGVTLEPTAVVFDGARIIAGDRRLGLIAIDPASGAVSVLASGTSYPILKKLSGLSLAGPIAYGITTSAANGEAGALVAIPLDGAAPARLTDFCNGGRFCEIPAGVAYDAANDRALVMTSTAVLYAVVRASAPAPIADCKSVLGDAGERGLALDGDVAYFAGAGVIARIELSTGSCTAIPAPMLRQPTALALRGSELLAVDRFHEALFAIDAGATKLLADTFIGDGPNLDIAVSLAYDREHDRLYAADNPADAILSVGAATGARAVISRGDGDGVLTAIALDPLRGRALIATRGSLRAVDLATGVQTSLGGEGPLPVQAEFVAIPGTGGRAFFTDRRGDPLYELDLETHDRTLFTASIAIGEAGPVAASAHYLAVTERRAPEIFLVEVISRVGFPLLGADPGFVRSDITTLAIDEDAKRVLFIDETTELRAVPFDGSSGPITIAGPERGRGPSLRDAKAIVFRDSTTVIVAAERGAQLIAVDLGSGDRALVSR